MTMAQKRQGNRFAQTPRLDDPRPPPTLPLEAIEAQARDAGGTEFPLTTPDGVDPSVAGTSAVHAIVSSEKPHWEKAMQTDLETLRQVVIDTAKKSPVGENVQDVSLEPAQDSEGGEYLRVMIRMKSIDGADRPMRVKLIEFIEDAVGELDERYPSVRFPDAA